MKEIFNTIINEMKNGRNVVLVTVVASSGSTPRGAGARMVIGGKGLLSGTIGGGAVEFEAQKMAADFLNERKSDSFSFVLEPAQVQDLGMVCGSAVNALFQFIESGDTETLQLLEIAAERMSGTQAVWLVTEVESDDRWKMFLTNKSTAGELPDGLLKNDSIWVDTGSKNYFAEPLVNSGFVYIFGGGHVAQELEPILTHVGFRCIVYDEIPEFANNELFPTAEKVVVGDFDSIASKVEIMKDDYIVVVTRGHKFDYEAIQHALNTPACYIGLIGSRKKMTFFNERLVQIGFAIADIEKRIKTPIGLDIKAETPEEIAISIAGEMIQVRAEAAKV